MGKPQKDQKKRFKGKIEFLGVNYPTLESLKAVFKALIVKTKNDAVIQEPGHNQVAWFLSATWAAQASRESRRETEGHQGLYSGSPPRVQTDQMFLCHQERWNQRRLFVPQVPQQDGWRNWLITSTWKRLIRASRRKHILCSRSDCTEWVCLVLVWTWALCRRRPLRSCVRCWRTGRNTTFRSHFSSIWRWGWRRPTFR